MGNLKYFLLIPVLVVLVILLNVGISGRLVTEEKFISEPDLASDNALFGDTEVASVSKDIVSNNLMSIEQPDAIQAAKSNKESAQQSIRRYLNETDQRTPQVATYVPRVKATQEELSDPDAYRAYQARQNETHARVYASAAMDKMGAYEARIRQAQLEGGFDQREIDKALERLEKLREMQAEIQQKHPHWQ